MKLRVTLLTLFGVASMFGQSINQANEIGINTYGVLEVNGTVDIKLVHENGGNLSTTLGKQITSYVKSVLQNESLVLDFYGIDTADLDDDEVVVPFNHLRKIIINGSGDVSCDDLIESNNLEIVINSSGDISLPVEAENLNISINGSGDVELKGEASNTSIKIAGSGDVNAEELQTENAKIESRGSGDVEVYVSENLKATTYGSGDINYHGSPENIKANASGSGDINHI